MSNIIDQAQKIIDANGFSDSECFSQTGVDIFAEFALILGF